MAKSGLSQKDRDRLSYLTAQIRRDTRPAAKKQHIKEIRELIDDRELTRSDYALIAFYTGNSGQSVKDAQDSATFAQAYRATPEA